MKQKRKYHELSDDACEITETPKIKSGQKRMKMSQSVMLDEIDPEEEEIWLVKLPAHLNPNQLYDKKV